MKPLCNILRLLLVVAVLPPLTAATVAAQAPTASGPWYNSIEDVHHVNASVQNVSGTNLSGTYSLEVPDGAWVNAIEFGERGDRPCHIKLIWVTVDNGVQQRSNAQTSVQFSPCTETARSLKTVGFYNHIGGRSLSVCQRNSNDRLKGISLRGRTLSPNGAFLGFTGSPQTQTVQRTNCNDWDNYEACPAGQAIVGVQVKYVGNGNNTQIKGLAPICSRLRIE